MGNIEESDMEWYRRFAVKLFRKRNNFLAQDDKTEIPRRAGESAGLRDGAGR